MEIANAEALAGIFGQWPSFHDAEVIAVRMDRGTGFLPLLEIDVHVFAMTDEVDADGYFVLRHHTLTTLRFDGVTELELDGFNNQNVIAELEMWTGEAGRLSVDLDPSYGLRLTLVCERCTVVRAEPFRASV